MPTLVWLCRVCSQTHRESYCSGRDSCPVGALSINSQRLLLVQPLRLVHAFCLLRLRQVLGYVPILYKTTRRLLLELTTAETLASPNHFNISGAY